MTDEVLAATFAVLRRVGAHFALLYGSRATGTHPLRVLRLLRSVSDDLGVLRTESAAADRRADPLWLRGVKYTFVTAVEACIDVATTSARRRDEARRATTATPCSCSGRTAS